MLECKGEWTKVECYENVGGWVPSSSLNSDEVQIPPPTPPTRAQPKSESRAALPTIALQQDAAENPSVEVARKIHTVTFGVENADSHLYDMCAGQGAHNIQVAEEVLRAACKRRQVDADAIIDARMFPDPDAQYLTRHSGRHHLIITRLCKHRNFAGWLQSNCFFRPAREDVHS